MPTIQSSSITYTLHYMVKVSDAGYASNDILHM